MTIAATCPECDAVFRVGDEHAGRRFRCKQCGATCQVPDQGKSEPKEAPPRKKRRSTRPPSTQRPQRAVEPVDEWEQDDYGYDEYSSDYDDYEQYEEYRPVLRSRPKKRGRTRASKSASVDLSGFSPILRILKGVGVGLLALVGFGVVVALAVTLGQAASGAARPLGVGLLFLGYVVVLVGNVALIVQAFREDIVVGLLFLFVPFYPLYWLISRWDEARTWFGVSMAGVLIAAFGAGLAAPIQ